MGEKPRWKTESRYPLSDRLVQQAEGLFGVRFGKQTRYCLLDIDITSVYHPQHDVFAISNLVAALEPLGLVSYVACTSSYSQGIHLYFPFQPAQHSWELAIAVAALLEKAGFKLAPGQLEIFPNPRTYVAGSHPSLFHAHRLPMQVGSYLLDRAFQAIWSDRPTFVQQWQFAQNRNALDTRLLKELVQTRTKLCQVSGKAEKFLADLNAEIASGWTGSGQTNHLLGRIALRTYVFHHILAGGEPLTGQKLIDEIVTTARSLPGYQNWCRHQHEIGQRATEWARCVEGSHYFPYGSRRSTPETAESIRSALSDRSQSWNQQQSESVRERIKQAIVHLLETNTLPVAITARFQALTQFGISGSSLYRHKDLWHPGHLTDSSVDPDLDLAVDYPVENPPDPPTLNDQRSDSAEGASDPANSTSLFPSTGRNALQHQASTRSIEPYPATGCKASPLFPFSFPLLPSALCLLPSASLAPAQRMQQFLDSGDPILVAEALSYFQAQPVNLQCSTAPAGTALRNHESSQFFMGWGSDVGLRSDIPPAENGEDLSDLLATITIEIRRLGWAKEQVVEHLWQQFGKSHQSRLSHEELVKWLEWLQADGFPTDTG